MKLSKIAWTLGAGITGIANTGAAVADAPSGDQPNIVVILTDDMGYSDLSCFGGEIPTPNICALAEDGVKMTDFYTSPLSAPTRSMLLTGVDNHQAGLGNMPPILSANQVGRPGYEGVLNSRVVTVAEMLNTAGYQTYMTGKWHLGNTMDNSAKGRGFQRSFSLTAGGMSHWADQLPMESFDSAFAYYMEDGIRVDELPADFYSSNYYTDKMIQYIKEGDAKRPFFGYLAYTAPHDPLHAPDEWIAKFNDGRYDVGYDVIRKRRLENVKKLGLVDKNTPDVAKGKDYKPWDQLSDQEKKVSSKSMAVYAAMVANVDYNVGRVVEHLKKTGQYDNTIFVYTHDNGANPKSPRLYGGNTPKFLKEFNNSVENIGRPGSFASYHAGWADVGTTPYAYYKTTTGEGGLRVPLLVSGKGIKGKSGFVKSGNMHVADLTPTIIDWAGVTKPTERNGIKLHPFSGVSWEKFLSGEASYVRNGDDTIQFEVNGNKMLLKGNYKVRSMPYGYGGEWRLFNVKTDPTEQTDLAKKHPEKLKELVALFDQYAKDVGLVEKDPSYPAMWLRQTWSIRDGRFADNPNKKTQ